MVAPDFLAPVPAGFEPALEDELHAVAVAEASLVRAQLEMAFRIGEPPAAVRRSTGVRSGDPRAPVPAELREALDRGGEALVARRAADQLAAYWRAVLARSWPTVRQVLADDVAGHAARVSRVGFGYLFDQIHPALSWDGSVLELRLPYDVRRGTDDGVVLVPSALLIGLRRSGWVRPVR